MLKFEFYLDKAKKIMSGRYYRDEASPLDYLNMFQHEGNVCVVTNEQGLWRMFIQKRGKWHEEGGTWVANSLHYPWRGSPDESAL